MIYLPVFNHPIDKDEYAGENFDFKFIDQPRNVGYIDSQKSGGEVSGGYGLKGGKM